MSTEWNTKINGTKIVRFAGKEGVMFLIKKKLKSNPLYSNWDVYHKLTEDSITLSKKEATEIALQLLEIVTEEV
tara:strand:- start:181 stop:402 length:222 start_codon:yes stop_codon:yes gene_type:complete